MKTKNTFGISFFCKKDKAVNGFAPLYLRVTVNRKYIDISLKEKIEVSRWDYAKGKLSGNLPEIKRINFKLEQFRSKAMQAYTELKEAGKLLSPERIKAKILGEEEQPITLLYLIEFHKQSMTQKLQSGTYKNYYSTEKFVKEFLITHFKTSDLHFRELNNRFLFEFDTFLRNRKPDKGQRPCGQNTIMKHIERLKKILNHACRNDLIPTNPFDKFSLAYLDTEIECLDKYELERFESFRFDSVVKQKTRDFYIFSCYTGLAYGDIFKLHESDIVRGIDGKYWIDTTRKKTRMGKAFRFKLPLMPQALEIMNKYKEHPERINSGLIFPVFSNQVYNRYLKILAVDAGINKKLTTHIARHTFATTIALSNGVPIETLSAIMGHQKITTTQIYAKVVSTKVSTDMQKLEDTLKLKIVQNRAI